MPLIDGLLTAQAASRRYNAAKPKPKYKPILPGRFFGGERGAGDATRATRDVPRTPASTLTDVDYQKMMAAGQNRPVLFGQFRTTPPSISLAARERAQIQQMAEAAGGTPAAYIAATQQVAATLGGGLTETAPLGSPELQTKLATLPGGSPQDTGMFPGPVVREEGSDEPAGIGEPDRDYLPPNPVVNIDDLAKQLDFKRWLRQYRNDLAGVLGQGLVDYYQTLGPPQQGYYSGYGGGFGGYGGGGGGGGGYSTKPADWFLRMARWLIT